MQVVLNITSIFPCLFILVGYWGIKGARRSKRAHKMPPCKLISAIPFSPIHSSPEQMLRMQSSDTFVSLA